MVSRLVTLVVLIIIAAPPVWASGGGGASPSAERLARTALVVDPDYAAGEAAVKQKNWPEAIARLAKVVQRDETNADAWNLLGYSHRNLGEMDKSFMNYERALTINPQHKDAHEYVGEAYLQVGNLAKAEEHLRALDKICWLPCEQYTELKEKIEAFKRKSTNAPG